MCYYCYQLPHHWNLSAASAAASVPATVMVVEAARLGQIELRPATKTNTFRPAGRRDRAAGLGHLGLPRTPPGFLVTWQGNLHGVVAG